jgi:N-acetylglucosamine kinase-like BadF-type ATPase
MLPTVEVERNREESKSSDLILALDAGGTKTAAWLVESTGGTATRIVGRGRSTSGNPLSVGFIEATRVITEAVSQARGAANRQECKISRAVMSIAGAIDPEMRNQFIKWAREVGLASQIAIVSDVLPVLAAGTPQCCGVALISGTGSAAFARSPDGRTSLCGGWGFLLGDEGSGYAIGRAAMRGALDDDEMHAQTRPLTEALLKSLNVRSAKELTKTIYRKADPRATIASAAPLVIQAAEDGDPFAAGILDAAARDLASLAARAARMVGLADGPFALAVTGGVLVSSRLLQNQLQRELRALGLDSDLGIVEEPLAGCLRLADPQFSEVAVQWQ